MKTASPTLALAHRASGGEQRRGSHGIVDGEQLLDLVPGVGRRPARARGRLMAAICRVSVRIFHWGLTGRTGSLHDPLRTPRLRLVWKGRAARALAATPAIRLPAESRVTGKAGQAAVTRADFARDRAGARTSRRPSMAFAQRVVGASAPSRMPQRVSRSRTPAHAHTKPQHVVQRQALRGPALPEMPACRPERDANQRRRPARCRGSLRTPPGGHHRRADPAGPVPQVVSGRDEQLYGRTGTLQFGALCATGRAPHA